MKDLKIFINLTRLNRPIGYLLLFWPCSWGLAYAYSLNKNIETFLFYIVLFFYPGITWCLQATTLVVFYFKWGFFQEKNAKI